MKTPYAVEYQIQTLEQAILAKCKKCKSFECDYSHIDCEYLQSVISIIEQINE